MNNEHYNMIPTSLKFIEKKLLKSVIPYADIQLTKEIPSVTASKIAGLPFLPYNEKLPVTKNGQIMYLLIQINFAEAPLPSYFPQEGILQVFIDPNYLNNKSIQVNRIPEDYYEIRFYPHAINDVIALESVDTEHNDYALKQELGIKFKAAMEPISSSDYRFNKFVTNNDIAKFYDYTTNPFEEIYAQHFLSATNKIGGYPFFIKQDVRQTDSSLLWYDTLLFQIISNDEDQIMIGDCGVIKLFINKYDLTKKQFSDVLLFIEDYS